MNSIALKTYTLSFCIIFSFSIVCHQKTEINGITQLTTKLVVRTVRCPERERERERACQESDPHLVLRMLCYNDNNDNNIYLI